MTDIAQLFNFTHIFANGAAVWKFEKMFVYPFQSVFFPTLTVFFRKRVIISGVIFVRFTTQWFVKKYDKLLTINKISSTIF